MKTNPGNNTIPIAFGDLLVALASILVLTLFFYCGIFAVPSADDYAYANILLQNDFWQSQINSYLGWTGRYMSSLLIMWFAGYHMNAYWLVPTVTLSLVFAAFSFLYWTLFGTLRNLRHFFLWPLSFFALYLADSVAGHGVGVVNEGFFWLSGAVTYQLAAVWYFSFCGSCIWMARRKHTVSATGLASVFAFLTVGSNETIMMLCCMTLAFLLWYYRQRWHTGFFIVAAVVLLSCVVVVAAPGNSVRLATAHERSILSALGICVEKVVETYFYALANPLLWLFALYFRTVQGKMLDSIKSFLSVRWFVLGGIAVIYTLYFPVAWSLDSGAPDRLVSFIGFIGFFFAVFFIHLLIGKVNKFVSLRVLTAALTLAALVFSPFFNEPLFVAAKTARFARAFHASHMARNAYVRQMASRGIHTVTVQPIVKLPLLLFRDLDHPDHAVHYAKYYGLQAVNVAK